MVCKAVVGHTGVSNSLERAFVWAKWNPWSPHPQHAEKRIVGKLSLICQQCMSNQSTVHELQSRICSDAFPTSQHSNQSMSNWVDLARLRLASNVELDTSPVRRGGVQDQKANHIRTHARESEESHSEGNRPRHWKAMSSYSFKRLEVWPSYLSQYKCKTVKWLRWHNNGLHRSTQQYFTLLYVHQLFECNQKTNIRQFRYQRCPRCGPSARCEDLFLEENCKVI